MENKGCKLVNENWQTEYEVRDKTVENLLTRLRPFLLDIVKDFSDWRKIDIKVTNNKGKKRRAKIFKSIPSDMMNCKIPSLPLTPINIFESIK